MAYCSEIDSDIFVYIKPYAVLLQFLNVLIIFYNEKVNYFSLLIVFTVIHFDNGCIFAKIIPLLCIFRFLFLSLHVYISAGKDTSSCFCYGFVTFALNILNISPFVINCHCNCTCYLYFFLALLPLIKFTQYCS